MDDNTATTTDAPAGPLLPTSVEGARMLAAELQRAAMGAASNGTDPRDEYVFAALSVLVAQNTWLVSEVATLKEKLAKVTPILDQLAAGGISSLLGFMRGKQ